MTCEIRDLIVVPSYDVAFCYGLHHVAGTTKAGQKVEFGIAAGRRGPQALSLKIIDAPPSLTRTRRESAAAEHKHTPDELHGMVEDMITLLESAVQPELRKGRYPDRKVARRVSDVVRAVASELDA